MHKVIHFLFLNVKSFFFAKKCQVAYLVSRKMQYKVNKGRERTVTGNAQHSNEKRLCIRLSPSRHYYFCSNLISNPICCFVVYVVQIVHSFLVKRLFRISFCVCAFSHKRKFWYKPFNIYIILLLLLSNKKENTKVKVIQIQTKNRNIYVMVISRNLGISVGMHVHL